MQCKEFRKTLAGFLLFISSFSLGFPQSAFEGKSRLVGRVSDENGNPVAGYVLNLEKKAAVTDASGIFCFDDMNSGEYMLSGGKKGYTHCDETVFFDDKRKIYAIQVETADSFYEKVSKTIEDGDIELASALLEEEKYFNGGDRQFKYYEAFIEFYNFPTEENKKKFLKHVERLQKGRR